MTVSWPAWYVDFLRCGAVLLALAAGAGCGRSEDITPPLAAPTVTLNRSEAAVGELIDMTYRFEVSDAPPALSEDLWVFVHFKDQYGELMWTDDHQPPTPIRDWQPGTTVEYVRELFLPLFPYAGPAHVEVGVYALDSGVRLPLRGREGAMRSYRVASFDLRPQGVDDLPVLFGIGWYERERSGTGGPDWQWSRREAEMWVPNPGRDATIVLQVDQPVTALPGPQQVEIRLGPSLVDTFPLSPGEREVRRIAVPADRFGEADEVRMTLEVEPAFVPSAIPELGSNDSRELGVRIFGMVVQPD